MATTVTGHANGISAKDLLTDLESEQAVLGAILHNPNHLIDLAARLKPDDFYHAQHQSIFEAMLDLYHKRVAPDDLTVWHWLVEHGKQDGIERLNLTEMRLSDLSMRDPSYYAEMVIDRSRRRRFYSTARDTMALALDMTKPAQQILAESIDQLSRISDSTGYRMYETSQQLAERAFDRYQQGAEQVIRTGFPDIDRIIGGFKPGQLIVPAARPGAGKSAMQAQMLYQQVKAGHRVGLVTLEMTADEIFDRIVAFHSGVDMNFYRTDPDVPQHIHDRVMTAVGQLGDMPFYIDGNASGTLADTMSRARLMHATEGIEALYVDYLQLVTVERKENRTQEVSAISRGLKRLARQLNVPVIAASQLSRQSEHRAPILSDLRESGSIEQDADIVIFIHRPDAYNENAPKNVAEILIAKHRNGPDGDTRLTWLPKIARFASYTEG